MSIEHDDTGPPKDTDGPPDIHRLGRRYPQTPMPSDFDEEVDEHPGVSRWQQALIVLGVALLVGHLWTVWTIRTDMNAVMYHLNEVSHQNRHMTRLLQSQQAVKWQIVPS